MNNQPWECPRCRTWNSPNNMFCNCKPIKREYCYECLFDAFSIFNPPYPSLDVIHAYAEDFHLNHNHSNKKVSPPEFPIPMRKDHGWLSVQDDND